VDSLNVTIKLSGHVLFPSLTAKPDIKSYVKSIREVKALKHNPFVVLGGGEPARYYIKIARENGADESTCDQIGIAIANINAKIFIRAMGEEACQFVPTNADELDKALSTGKVVVMGGLQPGQSTNAVACILAERSGSKLLINTTTVDGVYSGDPKKDGSAKKYSKITVAELTKVLAGLGSKAGEYDLLDPVALKIIQRSKIITRIIDGSDPKNILRAIKGEDIGTTIVP
jgi:uridylate kinase